MRTKPETPTTATKTIWISTLIPRVGAETYDGGIRLAFFDSEREALHDLNDWLNTMYPDQQSPTMRKADIIYALNIAPAIHHWSVQSHKITV